MGIEFNWTATILDWNSGNLVQCIIGVNILVAYDGNIEMNDKCIQTYNDVVLCNDTNYTNYNGFTIGDSYDLYWKIDEVCYFGTSDQSANFSTYINVDSYRFNGLIILLAWYRMGDNGAYKSPQWLIPKMRTRTNYLIIHLS